MSIGQSLVANILLNTDTYSENHFSSEKKDLEFVGHIRCLSYLGTFFHAGHSDCQYLCSCHSVVSQ